MMPDAADPEWNRDDFKKEQIKVHSTIYRACPDRNCKYSRLIFIKRPGTPKGKGTAVCGLGYTEEDCDKLKE
ncbi:MAG: hypothetical protein J6U54_07610 [Clostridiales bacterium]|nr:hypothetical protein [Clostridiales bacterium]